jgi:hypothetical protein
MQHRKRAARGDLAEKAAKDPDAQLFLKRAKEPMEDCLAAIERRIARISGTASQPELA